MSSPVLFLAHGAPIVRLACCLLLVGFDWIPVGLAQGWQDRKRGGRGPRNQLPASGAHRPSPNKLELGGDSMDIERCRLSY